MRDTISYPQQSVELPGETVTPTNPPIDEHLIALARKLGSHKSKKDSVNATLDARIRRHKQAALISLFGTIDYDPAYNYKRERAKTRL